MRFQAIIDNEVKLLLELKNNYKTLTKTDWKPGVQPSPLSHSTVNSSSPSRDANDISKKILEQGDKVRKLKSEKADKVC